MRPTADQNLLFPRRAAGPDRVGDARVVVSRRGGGDHAGVVRAGVGGDPLKGGGEVAGEVVLAGGHLLVGVDLEPLFEFHGITPGVGVAGFGATVTSCPPRLLLSTGRGGSLRKNCLENCWPTREDAEGIEGKNCSSTTEDTEGTEGKNCLKISEIGRGPIAG